MVLLLLFAIDIGFGLILIRENGHTLRGNPHCGSKLWHVLLGFIGVRGPLQFGGHYARNTVHAVLAGLGAISLLAAVACCWSARPVRCGAPRPRTRRWRTCCSPRRPGLAGLVRHPRRPPADLSPSGKSAVSFRVVGGVALVGRRPAGRPGGLAGRHRAFLDPTAREAAWVPAVMGCQPTRAAQPGRGSAWTCWNSATRRWWTPPSSAWRAAPCAASARPSGGSSGPATRCSCAAAATSTRARVDRSSSTPPTGGARAASSAASRWLWGASATRGRPAACIATAHDAEGKLRALLQFVPWGKTGLSLDVMRRDPAADNGVNEALIVAVLTRGPELGIERVSLNFAVFRSALERGGNSVPGRSPSAWRKLLIIGSRWWQIEQLARFNAKFEPHWVPRYMCYPGSLELPSVAIAALRAEAFLVLPGHRPRGRAHHCRAREKEPLCR